MKRFLLGVVAGAVLAAVALVVVFFASLKSFSRKPALPQSACLVLDLQGELPEFAGTEAPLPVLEQQAPVAVHEVWHALDQAARDTRIRCVLLKPRALAVGWGKLDEIRNGIGKVRKAGKPVYASLMGPGLREYYLASAADRIFLSPEDVLDVKGLRIEASYFKGSLDKLGVQMEVKHVGKYKDAGDIFSRNSMSPETREVLNSILDDTFARVTKALGEGRNKSAEEMRALVDDGPFLAPAAKEKGLVDELAFEREAERKLLEAAKLGEKDWVTLRAYARSEESVGKNARRIALLVAQGDILRLSPGGPFGEDQIITPAGIRREIRRISRDGGIRGVILRVDSGGGDAIASDEILHDLRELSKKKPLVISMSDAAASGGYYIAMTGDPIVAYPGTFTGSIGVVYGKANLRGLYDKLGINKELLTRGRFADIDSSYRPLSPEGRKKLRESLEFIYSGFLDRVSEGRKRPKAELEPLAQGRVWLGSQALDNRLVDEIGGLDTSIQLLRKKAGIGAADAVRLVIYPQRRTFFEQLLGTRDEMLGAGGFDGQELALRLLAKRAGALPLERGLLPWLAGGYLRVTPYRLTIE